MEREMTELEFEGKVCELFEILLRYGRKGRGSQAMRRRVRRMLDQRAARIKALSAGRSAHLERGKG